MTKKIIKYAIIGVAIILVIVLFQLIAKKTNIIKNTQTIIENKFKNYVAIDTSINESSIAYVPIDDRPVNVDRVKYLAESIGYDLKLPQLDDYKTYLDNTGKNKYNRQYGNPQEIAKWLEKMENSGCDYYIISIDQLFSGGLVGSRYLNDEDFQKDGTNFEYVKQVFETILKKEENKVYLIDTVMRLASTVNFMGLNTNDYNAFRLYSSVERKKLTGNDLTVDNIVNNYRLDKNGNEISNSLSKDGKNYNITLEKLNRYLKARERKLKIYDYYNNFIKNKNNVFTVITIDDSSNYENSIQQNEIDYINKTSNKELYIRDGADEQGMLMLSKLALDNSKINISVKTRFYGDKENEKIGLSFHTYKENYNSLLKSVGIKETDKNQDFDILIYTSPKDNNKVEEVSNELLNQYIDNIKNHIPTVIIESQDENGEYLRKKMIEEVPLGYLIGYSKWNLFPNSSGIALSEGIVRYLYLRSNKKQDSCDIGFLKLMTFSYIKDIGYIPNLRSKYNNDNVEKNNQNLTNDMKQYEELIIKNMTEKSNIIADLLNYTERGVDTIKVSNYHFPWHRGFEMNFDISAAIGSTKNLTIEYLGNKKEEKYTTEQIQPQPEQIEIPDQNENTNNEEQTNNNQNNQNNNNPNNEQNNQNNNNNNNNNNNSETYKKYVTHYSYISPDYNKTFDYYSKIKRSETAKWLCKANNLPIDTTYKSYYKDVNKYTENWQYINTATKYGYFIGDGNSNFNPNNYITRAEFVTAILRVVEKNRITYDTTCSTYMPDVQQNKWYYENMKKAARYCIIKGNDKGEFNPNDFTTKVEAVTMINRALKRNHNNMNCQSLTTNPFSNITTDYWGYKDLLEAAVTHTCWY